jgi:hypothetical protein
MSQLIAALLLLSVAAFGGCQSGDGDDDRQTCLHLVDHLVDLQLGDEGAGDSAHSAEIAKHRAILRHAIEDRVVADCLKRPRAHTECALHASTSADLKECD